MDISSPPSFSKVLPVREVAMMAIMDQLTDKPEWHHEVFDRSIVDKWREEALAVPDSEWMKIAAERREDGPGGVNGWEIVDAKTFDLCIEELQTKALYYEKTGLIPTLDASAAVVKSDVAITENLRDALRKAFEKLKRDQADSPARHPNLGHMVQDLVHPSMHPLVYGQTKVFEDEVVGVFDAIDKWAGKGNVLDEEQPQPDREPFPNFGPNRYWSATYQWLPSNVIFQDDGSVKLTSYINNLHPTKYPEIYVAIEQMINTAIPAWDQCLLTYQDNTLQGPGLRKSRFTPLRDLFSRERRSLWSPSHPAKVADAELDLSTVGDLYGWVKDEAERKWMILRKPVLYGPCWGCDAHYDSYITRAGVEKTEGRLFRKFKASGLQIIVKMTSIELTPDKPESPLEDWHGLMNEKICATALFCLDSENITECSLNFRMQMCDQQDVLETYIEGDYIYEGVRHWLECVYGFNSADEESICIQNYGHVEIREGRLLAFPGVFQHRVSPFKLVDPTKPGHRRFIALWLVDPHERIISTANVPPQQRDWWVESAFGESSQAQREATRKIPFELLQLLYENGVELDFSGSYMAPKLPLEILDLVRQDFELDMMSPEEALEHQRKLMEERAVWLKVAQDDWNYLTTLVVSN
ncbi:hypothetical protein M406DRAFT_250309 [Cryphonectria parasitica EP155]|uniref:Uncharacterized protein n=1 Tax=Cryphonectria parasitica (strain ATCC 38755 / EP155) TaxID=660469 RepID=A0A9P4Y9K0_CRYP1|nr:uncharacterized protein M406DRAFT_250309 [Cryphonectria parasitica EP155]KAF3769013.1 hypothetical protein M406DRAFT_250309 [Cryphonectria parasitica EP155]